MKIKALQMQGFKSFADKTEIHFDNHIVGVVGPNGCGKSNIVDAIRWAMGEQSAKGLRGSEMSDVIFNGTASRKRASFAEVSLIFNNTEKLAPAPYTDCDEIMITRRLFRSGESEYLINKVAVRLKDIMDVFLGTGSSAKAYSIVAQGKIDQVVLAKPEERRFLLEEAAGVAKYKVRKQAAERKMEATRANLSRVDDIVQELERNARSLERQVDRAEAFRKIQTELRQLDEQIVGAKLTQLDRKANENSEKRSGAQTTFEVKAAELSKVEAAIETLRFDTLNLEKVSSSDYEQLFQLKERFAQADKDAELSLQRVELLQNQIVEREKDIERLVSKTESSVAASQQLLADLEKLQSERDLKKSALEVVKSQIDEQQSRLQELEAKLQEMETQLQNAKTNEARAEQKEEFWKNETKTLENRRTQLQTQMETERAGVIRLTSELEANEAQFQNISAALKLKEQRLSELEVEQRAHLARQSELMQQRMRLQDELSQKEAELASYQTLEDHQVGYDAGALDRKKQTGLPFLMDSLQVKSEFRALGEAFLHAFGQSFLEGLMPNEPLQARFSYFISTGSPVAGRRLSEIAEDNCPEAVRQILDRIELVESISSEAMHAQMDLEGRFRMPLSSSLQWESIGQVTHTESPALRKMGVEQLKIDREQLNSQLGDLDTSLSVLRMALDENQKEGETLRADLKSIRGEEQQAREMKMRAKAQLEALEQSLERNATELKTAEERLLWIDEQLKARVRAALENLEADCKQMQMQVDAVLKEKAALDGRWIETRIEFGALEERVERLKEQSIHAEMTRSEYEHNRGLYKTDIENWRAEIAKEQHNVEDLRAQKSGDQTSIADLERRLAENKDLLNQKRSSVEQEEVARKDLAQEKEKLQVVVQELELEHQRLKFEVEELSNIVQERYHISLQDLLAQVPPEALERLEDQVVLQALEVEALELREKLERFGDVNLLALTEFEEIKKRLEFIQNQRADLLKTLDSLQSLIDRINQITEFRFRETFKAINHNFQVLFPKLFGGGQAYMTLTNENNLLETGVEIFAEPPGKKVQNMSLLSGGEKAMTSISLLFALFAYRPASFCILDEVDAPLDEVNTMRYNAIIKEMSSLSQFIVITHNKRTMEGAEMLFGVTMQEPGVSQMVGVHLDEAKAFVATGT